MGRRGKLHFRALTWSSAERSIATATWTSRSPNTLGLHTLLNLRKRLGINLPSRLRVFESDSVVDIIQRQAATEAVQPARGLSELQTQIITNPHSAVDGALLRVVLSGRQARIPSAIPRLCIERT